jgi:2-dehydro-3-deoxyphosphogluconate aldolase/(4S)-4-hydroxy-2-oxoglutarate aldolase
MDVKKFKELPLLGILRGIEEGMVEPLVEAVVSAGLKTIEITMNTAAASSLIRQMVKASDGRLVVGAGTVLTMGDLHSALDAGATFIVLPVLVPDVVEYCVKNSIPVFPGALTPQEIHNAWRAGATMVKVFPAGLFGPKYFSEIKGPFNDIELLACGGVNTETIGTFFSCQASAAAFGGSIFKKNWLESGDFTSIRKSIETLISRIPMVTLP